MGHDFDYCGVAGCTTCGQPACSSCVSLERVLDRLDKKLSEEYIKTMTLLARAEKAEKRIKWYVYYANCKDRDVRAEMERANKAEGEVKMLSQVNKVYEEQIAESAAVYAERDRLREAFTWAEDLLMGTIPEYPECGNVQALDELRRKAKAG